MGNKKSKQKFPISPPETVPYVDIFRYIGNWYVIAQIPHIYTKGITNIKTEYTLSYNGSLKICNRYKRWGKFSVAFAEASIQDGKSNSKMTVVWRKLVKVSSYWIVKLGQKYQYSVVSDESYGTLFILSREPTMSEQLYKQIVSDLSSKGGFKVQLLEKIKHDQSIIKN